MYLPLGKFDIFTVKSDTLVLSLNLNLTIFKFLNFLKNKIKYDFFNINKLIHSDIY